MKGRRRLLACASYTELSEAETYGSNGYDLVKMMDVDMDKHSVQTSKDLLANTHKVLGKWCPYREREWREREEERGRERETRSRKTNGIPYTSPSSQMKSSLQLFATTSCTIQQLETVFRMEMNRNISEATVTSLHQKTSK